MPIYEYACPHCGQTFEEWLAHADDISDQTCPNCGHSARRILSNTTFILKGGGWYETDYGKKKEALPDPADHADAAAGAESDGKTGGKDDMPSSDSSQPAAQVKASDSSSSDAKADKKAEPAKMPPPANSSAVKPAANGPAQ